MANVLYAKNNLPPKSEEAVESNLLPPNMGLQVRSIDTQIVSKHWDGMDRASIAAQVRLIKDLNANYVAISTPYDRPATLTMWTEEIHKAGLNVWFRSHWLEWEGDEGHESTMTEEEYLARTKEFIIAHPAIFRENDAFTVCVEPEQIFVAKRANFFDVNRYNQFVSDQIDVANEAFTNIGLGGKIHTNWVSMNGWVVLNGLKRDTVKKLGVITVDHYPDQDGPYSSAELAKSLRDDLDLMYNKWRKPIILGEWGYNIKREVPEDEQRLVVKESLDYLTSAPYLLGINYWAHIGNTSRIIDDTAGKNYELRPAAYVLKDYFSDAAKKLETKDQKSSPK